MLRYCCPWHFPCQFTSSNSKVNFTASVQPPQNRFLHNCRHGCLGCLPVEPRVLRPYFALSSNAKPPYRKLFKERAQFRAKLGLEQAKSYNFPGKKIQIFSTSSIKTKFYFWRTFTTHWRLENTLRKSFFKISLDSMTGWLHIWAWESEITFRRMFYAEHEMKVNYCRNWLFFSLSFAFGKKKKKTLKVHNPKFYGLVTNRRCEKVWKLQSDTFSRPLLLCGSLVVSLITIVCPKTNAVDVSHFACFTGTTRSTWVAWNDVCIEESCLKWSADRSNLLLEMILRTIGLFRLWFYPQRTSAGTHVTVECSCNIVSTQQKTRWSRAYWDRTHILKITRLPRTTRPCMMKLAWPSNTIWNKENEATRTCLAAEASSGDSNRTKQKPFGRFKSSSGRWTYKLARLGKYFRGEWNIKSRHAVCEYQQHCHPLVSYQQLALLNQPNQRAVAKWS